MTKITLYQSYINLVLILNEVREALIFHQEQTRPIERTEDVLERTSGLSLENLRKSGLDFESPSIFKLGDRVEKIKGSQWKGVVVGTYSTDLTPEGYAVESDTEKGSVQIYPASALRIREGI